MSTTAAQGTYSDGSRVDVIGHRNGFTYITFLDGSNKGITTKVPASWVTEDRQDSDDDLIAAIAASPDFVVVEDADRLATLLDVDEDEKAPAIVKIPHTDFRRADSSGESSECKACGREADGYSFCSDTNCISRKAPAEKAHDFETEGRQDERTVTPCAVCGGSYRSPLHQ